MFFVGIKELLACASKIVLRAHCSNIPHSKMKVKLATLVLSQSAALALEESGNSEVLELLNSAE